MRITSVSEALVDGAAKAGESPLKATILSMITTIVRLEGHHDDWCSWALDNGMPPVLWAFMQDKTAWLPDGRHVLYSFEPTKQLENKGGCPRSWAAVGRMWNQGRREVEAYEGAVGAGNAAQFLAFTEVAGKLPPVKAILLDPDNAPLPDKPSLKYLASVALGRESDGNNFDRAMRYLMIEQIVHPKIDWRDHVRDWVRHVPGQLRGGGTRDVGFAFRARASNG